MNMKNTLKNSLRLGVTAVTLFLTSCSDNANDILTGDQDAKYEIKVNPTNTNTTERSVDIIANANSLVKVQVNFTGDKKMRRIYMTKNVYSDHSGPQPYEYSLGSKKSDGSIDLDGDDKDTFTYTFDFDTPKEVGDVVQYIIWTTNDRGDFRDVAKRNSIADDAFGTITIKAGANADTTVNGIKSFSTILLEAPLGNGKSKAFLSLFDRKAHKIEDGVEVAALWDFGYYYGKTHKASFASADNYPKDVVDIRSIAKLGNEDTLNKFYFKLSSKSNSDFESVTKKSDLDFITQPTSERVKNLVDGDIVEFVDGYGNKGLIRVTKIVHGDGKDGEIKFDVKVQFNNEPIKG